MEHLGIVEDLAAATEFFGELVRYEDSYGSGRDTPIRVALSRDSIPLRFRLGAS